MEDRAVVAMNSNGPSLLLLGGGYTLERAAQSLVPGSFVITSRSAERCRTWETRGWFTATVDLRAPESIDALFSAYPTLEVCIDGVPPLREGRADDGVSALCAQLSRSAAKRVVYLSTTGVFGAQDGSWVDEGTPTTPAYPPGQARLLCEQRYRISGVESVMLRVPAIYGPTRGIVESMRSGTYRLIGDGDRYSNRVHVDDLVRIVLAAATKEVVPETICVGDDYPAMAREVVEFVCSQTGWAWPPSISAEEAAARGAHTMLSHQRVRNGLMKEILGSPLRYPTFREGIAAILAEEKNYRGKN